VKLRNAKSTDLLHLKEFLESNSLPSVGLQGCLENFLIATDNLGSWVGVAGYEAYGNSVLLRSVAVSKEFRNVGTGRSLVEQVLANARKRGVDTVYLVTETAEGYFERLGFERIDRDQMDQAVTNSQVLRECCTSAQAMRRNL
jgi:amino-acid N-acetyltransferase